MNVLEYTEHSNPCRVQCGVIWNSFGESGPPVRRGEASRFVYGKVLFADSVVLRQLLKAAYAAGFIQNFRINIQYHNFTITYILGN